MDRIPVGVHEDFIFFEFGFKLAEDIMRRFDTGDSVRIDIPDETDPDYERLHGRRGTVIEIISDDAGAVTGDEREGYLFRVDLDDGETVDVRWRDLRPV
jgi:ribosomal protein L21E